MTDVSHQSKDARRILDICDAALALREDERESFLLVECAHEPGIRIQAQRLLRAIENSGRFMRVEY